MSEEQEIIMCLEGLKIGFKLNPDLNPHSVTNIFNYIDKAISLIEKQNKTMEKQNKAIDKMADHIVELQEKLFDLDMLKEYNYAITKEQIIKYYLGD